MAGTLAPLENIVNGDVGLDWYGKINTNNDKIESAFGGGLSPVGHTHEITNVSGLQDELNLKATSASLTSGLSTKANTVHSHTGDQLTVSISGSNVTVQDAITNILNYTGGLTSEATITGFEISGEDTNSASLTIMVALSAQTFGSYRVWIKFDTDSGTPDFSSVPYADSMTGVISINKPSDGYNVSSQMYMHLKVSFVNAGETQSPSILTSNVLFNKYSKDLTVEEIGDYLVGSAEIRSAIVADLIGRKDFRSAIATQINSM